MGSRVSLVENTTQKKPVKSTQTKIKKWPKRGRMSRRERITIGMSQMTKKWPKNPMSQLENPEEGPQDLEEKSLCPIRQTQRTPKGRIRKKSEDTEGHLRKLEDICPISIRMPINPKFILSFITFLYFCHL